MRLIDVICEIMRSEELFEGRSSQLYTQNENKKKKDAVQA